MIAEGALKSTVPDVSNSVRNVVVTKVTADAPSLASSASMMYRARNGQQPTIPDSLLALQIGGYYSVLDIKLIFEVIFGIKRHMNISRHSL